MKKNITNRHEIRFLISAGLTYLTALGLHWSSNVDTMQTFIVLCVIDSIWVKTK